MTAITCHACGSPRPADAPFCPACGATRSSTPPPPPPSPVRSGPAPASGLTRAPEHSVSSGPAPAEPRRRFLAFLVDGATGAAVVFAASVVSQVQLSSAIATGSSSAVAAAFGPAIFLPFAAWVVWAAVMLAVEGSTGRTPGNRALGIRTVSAVTGEAPGFGRALARRAIEQVGSLVVVGAPIVAYSAAWDSSGKMQGWQDRIAGTTMLDGRAPAASQPATAVAAAPAPPSPPAPPVSTSPRPTGGAPALPAPPPPAVPAPPAPTPAPPAPTPPAATPAAPSPAPHAPAPRSSAPFPVAPPAPAGIIDSVPGFVTSPPPQESPAAPITAAPAAAAPLADLDRTRVAAPRPDITPRRFRLAFDTGEEAEIEGSALIGRRPSASPGEQVRHVIPVADPDRSVSKSHAMVGIGSVGIWVVDRGSTNGTWVLAPDGSRTRVRSEPVPVPAGGVVEIGSRSFRVEAL